MNLVELIEPVSNKRQRNDIIEQPRHQQDQNTCNNGADRNNVGVHAKLPAMMDRNAVEMAGFMHPNDD